MLVNSNLPVSDLKDLIELSKKKPYGLSYGSAGGMGQFPTHVSPELFKLKYGLVAKNIPYRGAGLALIDLAAGRVDFAMSTGLVAAQPFLDSGKVRAIAVTGRQRLVNMPNVPTFLEMGYPLPELDEGVMFALFGPANLPPNVVNFLSNAVVKAFYTREMAEGLTTLGLTTAKNPGPKAHGAMMKMEVQTWTPIAKKMNLTE